MWSWESAVALPAYVFMFIEAMADEAVAAGMPRKQAYEFAAQSVLGSARMVLETGKHPGELKDMVMFSRRYHHPGSQSTGREGHACRCDGCHGRLHREVEMYVVTASTMNRVESKSHVNMIL